MSSLISQCPGIESRVGGEHFRHPSRPALGGPPTPVQRGPGLYAGHKAAGARRCSTTPSSTEVKEKVEPF